MVGWHPTLDDLESRPEPRDLLAPHRRRVAPCAEGTGPRDWPLGGGGCWCGQRYGHEWPGKAGRAPHPREPRRVFADEFGSGG